MNYNAIHTKINEFNVSTTYIVYLFLKIMERNWKRQKTISLIIQKFAEFTVIYLESLGNLLLDSLSFCHWPAGKQKLCDRRVWCVPRLGKAGMLGLAPKWFRLAPNGTNPWLFQIRFQYIIHLGKIYDFTFSNFNV